MQSTPPERKDQTTPNQTTPMRVTSEEPPMTYEPVNITERARAILAAELEAGGTLYGIRADGCYTARTKYGERILKRPPKFRPE